MKSFFGICVLSVLAAVGNAQPTHNSPHHTQPEHPMSQQEHLMSQPQQHIVSQPEPHFRQPNHYNNQPQHGYDSWSTAEAQAKAHSQRNWISPEPSYQPGEILSKPQHDYDSWSTAEAHAQAHSQGTWTPPEQPYQPVQILSEPHIIHPQPQTIDPQFEFNPYPYQHPHYPPTGSHHTQDTGPPYPAHGWNTQNPPVVYQHQLPEATTPEHHINSNKEDYPNQPFAVGSAVATASSNSVPDANHEPAHSQLYKMISIPKADNGANYNMPVADHETRRPNVILTSNDEDLPDIVQEILAKYRHIPIETNPKPENNVSSKEHISESHGPVHRPHKHKKHKIPTTIPVVTKQSSKAKAVTVSKTGTDNRYTIIKGGKHSTATKVPLKHKHKHSHKKVLKPLLDPELLAKELDLLSRELWVPSPDKKIHEKDIPCDDNPIVNNDRTKSEEADRSNSPDKIKLKDKPKDKHHHTKHLHKSVDTTEIDISKITTTPRSHIDDKKHADENTDCDSTSPGEASEPCDGDDPPEKANEHDPKPIVNEKLNINSKSKIGIDDFKEEKVVQRKEIKKEVTEENEAKKEENKEQFATKQYEGKLNQKKYQNPDETTEPCGNDYSSKEENKSNKHVPIPKTDDKQNDDPDQNKLNNKPSKHHHNKHEQPHVPANIGPEKNKTKTTVPSTSVNPVNQKDADMNIDCDSDHSDETKEPSHTVNYPEIEDKTKKLLPKPITDDTEKTASKLVDNKRNIDTITDHKFVINKEVKKEEKKIAETRKEETVHQSEKTKQQLEVYDAKQKPVEQGHKAPVNDDSIKGSGSQESNDKIPASEYKDKKEKSIPHIKKNDIKAQLINTIKGNDTDPDHSQPKNKPTHHALSHTPTNIVPENNKPKTTMTSTNVKSGRDKDCDPVDSDESTEPHDTTSAPEKKDKTKKLLPKPQTDDTKNTASKPVDKKGNLDTITDHEVLQKKDVAEEKIKTSEKIKEKTVHQSETIKQQPETYDIKQKPAQKDYKPINPDTTTDTHKGNKEKTKIIFAKNDVKKVEETKEVTQKVEIKKEAKTYQTSKPEKQDDKSSDIEDCNSTESNELQKTLEKTPEPEYKRELNEPLPKANHVNKASKKLTKEKKIVDKNEETVKVETKTKKPTKNLVSSDAVDKSKPIETSNENSDIDDCDSADSETDPKPVKEKHDPKQKKTEADNKKKLTIINNKAESKAAAQELTSNEVAEILEKTKTDQPLSTVGFLISLISHALQGSDSVRQMFEEPKVKTFIKDLIPMFHEKPKKGIVSD